ncbi:MAG: NADH-quinone oxidoreductase subunit, partial [Solirubrobacteraceae bacterium]|nr:NADH-quinone oxidoreductase subunit [Solirubrobacteraceae bacterium]
MPRPERQTITFSIDGLEVEAPENTMLADAAKYGDIEIPVFCYEPKLGDPVGACRMCLVEIEGIPKLQTACSSPVKDGMVVHTQTARVKEAQRSVVEFLLINHPLDCPVCDKGGECPLQDITFGWGPGRSRFIEPKRHFRKPLELSPLIAIDRERCILCYRCVRFSQELAEDYQLVLLERGAHSFVGTFDGHPYVAPFSGNIIELCPVGALTSIPYRFRARPWDIEGAGSICMLCPAQCNTELTVRDERVLRVLDRHHEGVDDGWLCDKGRFAYQAIHVDDRLTTPLVRDGGGELRPAGWDEALARAAELLAGAGDRTAALAGSTATNEEGMLLARMLRDALGSPHLDSRSGPPVDLDHLRALNAPALQASVPDLEFAHAVLVLDCEPVDDAPILEMRIRKGVRRNRVKLALATSRPSALDPSAAATARFAPGHAAAFLAALSGALAGAPDLDDLAAAAGCTAPELTGLAAALEGAQDVVVLYHDRILGGPDADADAAAGLLALAGQLGLGRAPGAGLIGIPEAANGRGLREAGVLPNAGPGLSAPPAGGRGAPAIAEGLANGDLDVLYLLGSDPLRDHPGRRAWEAGLAAAGGVIAHAAFLTEGIRDHADVVFPAEATAEKEGTVTHPDGRVQRLRPAIGRPGDVRPEWQVLHELSRRLGSDPGLPTIALCSEALFAAVPFYAGLTLTELGGRGVRWPVRPGAGELLPGGPDTAT